MPKLNDHDPLKWLLTNHTKVKHSLLEKYLKAWIPILGSYHGRVLYIDGFSGRGVYQDGSIGSPIIAMEACQAVSELFKGHEFRCFFIERDTDNYNNLCSEVEARKSSYPAVTEAMCINTEFNYFITDLLENTHNLAPSFFFIDPFGYTGVPFATIQNILRRPRTEIFLNFVVRDINRFLTAPGQSDNFNLLFGCDTWQQATELPSSERQKFLMDLYISRILDTGSARYCYPFRICEDEKYSTLYYMIYATNSFKGLDVMKGIMYNQSSEFAFLGPKERDQKFRQAQLTLFNFEEAALCDYLQRIYPSGTTRTYDEIRQETYMNTVFIDKHYRSAIKSLESNRKVSIQRVSSVRNGIKELDRITFT